MKSFTFILAILLLISYSCRNNQLEIPDDLIGVELQYIYSGGNAYHVSFSDDGMKYQFLSGSKPEKWWGPFPFKTMITEKGEHLVSWYEEGFGDYVTLLINFNENILYGSAIIFGKKTMTHFQKAEIKSIVIK